MTKKNNTGEPWLMASALLGMSRLRRMMEAHKLTLEQAEAELRGQTEDCLGLMNGLGQKSWPKGLKVSWHPAKLPARNGWLQLYLAAEEERMIKKRSPRFTTWETDNGWKVPVPVFPQGQASDFRNLWSWMLNEAGEEGGKLLIATAFERSNLNTRAKRRRQLEEDSRTVLEALEMLNRDPLKVRRQTGEGAALQLAKLSLKQQDRQDEEKTGREEDLRSQLEKARAEVRRIQAELKALIGTGGKTGK